MAIDLAADPALVRAPLTLWRTTMRGVLVSVPGNDEPLMCTSPADVVWELLAEPTRPSELAQILAPHYDADADRIAADLKPLLTQLGEAGALVCAQPNAPTTP